MCREGVCREGMWGRGVGKQRLYYFHRYDPASITQLTQKTYDQQSKEMIAIWLDSSNYSKDFTYLRGVEAKASP